MTDYKLLIADSFAEHWEKYFKEKALLPSSAQMELAALLLKYSYPVSFNEELKEDLALINDSSEPAAMEMQSTGGLRFYSYKWEPLAPQIRSQLFAKIGLVDGKYEVTDSTTQAEVCSLDWYEPYRLLRLIDPEWGNSKLCLYYLLGPENALFRLNGTSPLIHEVNAKAPIKLTEENVISYLIFFCFFVRGEEGPFYVLETMDDPLVQDVKTFPLDDKLMEATFSVMEATVRPAALLNINEEGHYLCEAVIAYSNALFVANLSVQPTGMIEMLEDEPIAAEMPFRINAPIT